MNVTPQEEYDVPPSTFGDLKKGGPKNGLNVEGIFFQGDVPGMENDTSKQHSTRR
jgi:hypothetical protein